MPVTKHSSTPASMDGRLVIDLGGISPPPASPRIRARLPEWEISGFPIRFFDGIK
jgi:hypothetical protein